MKEGVKKERKRVRREWCGNNWKWIVSYVIPGLLLAIVLYSISISFIVSKLQQSTFFQLKLCAGFSITKGMTKMVVPSDRCNSEKISSLDLSEFTQLKSIEIGDRCFENVKEVKLVGLDRLESVVIGDECFENVDEVKLIGLSQLERVVIGKNCFTRKKNDAGYYSNRHFYLKNCERLRELKMGHHSFSDYSVCKIESVPSLEVIDIGGLYGNSFSFYYASLELKSDFERME